MTQRPNVSPTALWEGLPISRWSMKSHLWREAATEVENVSEGHEQFRRTSERVLGKTHTSLAKLRELKHQEYAEMINSNRKRTPKEGKQINLCLTLTL